MNGSWVRIRFSMSQSETITVIQSAKSWLHMGWKDVWASRDLLLLLARRDINIIYKQTILGPVWFLIQPVLMAMVFAVIFGRIAGISTAGIPQILFYLCGLMVWNYFRGCLEGVANCFVYGKELFSKVYFPRLISPLTYPLSQGVFFLWNVIIFLAFYVFFLCTGMSARPTLSLLLFPLLILYICLAAMGPGLLIASVTVKYRDLRFALPFILQLWMYATPIIFSLQDATTPWIRALILLNPLTIAAEGARIMFFGTGCLSFGAIASGIAMTILLLVGGLVSFNRTQYTFVDTI